MDGGCVQSASWLSSVTGDIVLVLVEKKVQSSGKELLDVFLASRTLQGKQRGHPKWENLGLQRARFYKKITIFPDFGDAMSLRISSTFDSRAFQGV
jgi:hypothetical protein